MMCAHSFANANNWEVEREDRDRWSGELGARDLAPVDDADVAAVGYRDATARSRHEPDHRFASVAPA